MQDKQRQADHFNMRGGAIILNLLVGGLATTVTPFMRYGFGVEAFGLNALAAFVMILLYAGETRDPAMIYFFYAWLLAVIAQRLETWRLVRKGWVEHSRYAGYPWLAMKLPFIKKPVTAKNCVEPVLCLLVGALLCPLSEALGVFIMLGLPSLLIQRAIESQVNINRLRRMRDAAIEQRYLSDLYQGRRDDF
jgi:hypothetical protein